MFKKPSLNHQKTLKTLQNKLAVIFTDIPTGKAKTCQFHIFFYNFATILPEVLETLGRKLLKIELRPIFTDISTGKTKTCQFQIFLSYFQFSAEFTHDNLKISSNFEFPRKKSKA